MTAVVNSKLITRTYCPAEKPEKAIIGLHGWTGNEHVFEPVAKMMKVENAKWYFPRAPYKADTGKGYTWFSGNDEKGWEIEKTWAGMQQLLNHVIAEGFSAENIFLIGFSQGAGLAMEIALRLPHAIGGIIPIAGFIKFMDILEKEATEESKGTPILLLHGNRDKVIPLQASKKAYNFLKTRGNQVHFESYDVGHKIPLRTASMIRGFISDSFTFFEVNPSEFVE
jgi:phospholipase/carboxylesterase|tara:strand:- start:12172 stop:12846 length:675 start_codon:yes stop_codon:yes gene_type:complete